MATNHRIEVITSLILFLSPWRPRCVNTTFKILKIFFRANCLKSLNMSAGGTIMVAFQKILSGLGSPIDPESDPKISVALRPYLCYMRDEIHLANRAFIIVRRAALKKLIEDDYNRYMKELRKYDFAITRTQP